MTNIIIWDWLNYLESMKLTDHTQSMDGDEQYDHITIPDFQKVYNITYIHQLINNQFDNVVLESLKDCLDSDGGSPEGVRLELINILKKQVKNEIDVVLSQTEVSETIAYDTLIKYKGSLVDSIRHIHEM